MQHTGSESDALSWFREVLSSSTLQALGESQFLEFFPGDVLVVRALAVDSVDCRNRWASPQLAKWSVKVTEEKGYLCRTAGQEWTHLPGTSVAIKRVPISYAKHNSFSHRQPNAAYLHSIRFIGYIHGSIVLLNHIWFHQPHFIATANPSASFFKSCDMGCWKEINFSLVYKLCQEDVSVSVEVACILNERKPSGTPRLLLIVPTINVLFISTGIEQGGGSKTNYRP